MFKNILISLLFGFIGFASGRIGHIFGGTINSPHHWIYGLILIILGLITRQKYPQFFKALAFFGAGLFISDLKDFLDLKFFGVDSVTKFVFWSID